MYNNKSGKQLTNSMIDIISKYYVYIMIIALTRVCSVGIAWTDVRSVGTVWTYVHLVGNSMWACVHSVATV